MQVQARHQAVLDGDKAEDNFKAALTGSFVKAKTELPGNQWAQSVQNEGSDLMAKMQGDPANAHIAGYLKSRLPALLNVMTYQARDAGVVATAKEHADQADALQGSLATQAAGDWVIKPDGSFGDGPVASAIAKKNASIGDALWGKYPAARAQFIANYQAKLTKARGQMIASDHPEQMGAFLKANAGAFTGDEKLGYLGKANESFRMAQSTIDARKDQLRADELNYQASYIKQNGAPDMARLSTAAQLEHITNGDFRGFTGRDYQMPSDPATLTNYNHAIDSAPSLDALESIKANARSAADHKLLSGADIPVLDDRVDKRIEFIKTTVGKTDLDVRNMLKRIYYPYTAHDRSLSARYPGIFEQAHAQALGAYESATFGKPSDPAVYWQAYEKATKSFPRPGVDPGDVTPTPLPVPVTDAEAIKAKEVAKSLGIITKPLGPVSAR